MKIIEVLAGRGCCLGRVVLGKEKGYDYNILMICWLSLMFSSLFEEL
jgi:hypothetical protein